MYEVLKHGGPSVLVERDVYATMVLYVALDMKTKFLIM